MGRGTGIRRTALTAAVGWLLAAGAPSSGEEPPAVRSEARAAGLRALAAGDRPAARRHLRRALEDFPQSPVLLGDLLDATSDEPTSHVWWAHQYVAAIADKAGAFKPSKEAAAFLPKDDPHLKAVATARARAAAELARAAGLARGPGGIFVVRAFRSLFDRVAEASPVLRETYEPALDKAATRLQPTTADVVAALEAGTKAGGASPEAAAIRLRLGRALIGLASQARQKLEGTPDVDAERLLQTGERLVQAALAILAPRHMEPLSLAALDAMAPAEIAAFNEAHTTPTSPGRALSPNGLYEVTTPCGHGTLRAATAMVEGIHARLARWFGKDPFAKRRGLVRIVPEALDLDEEGAPYWWAAGFQHGAVTTVRFALGTDLDLAAVLTHEMTHRFDQAFHPAMPAWLLEGRAVWTGAAWRSLADEDFVDPVADVWRVADTWHTWYGTENGLKDLLGGVKDYRHNYSAGHALWTYLYEGKGPDGARLFREPLLAWLATMTSAPKDPVAPFAAAFCDGAHGRPTTLAGFAKGFFDFVEGFRAYPRPPWVEEYVPKRDYDRARTVLDGPTISRERSRDEPAFGQGHVLRAAHALAALDRAPAALLLLEWASAMDELDGEAAGLAVRLLGSTGGRAAAAAHLERLRRATVSDLREPPPGLADLAVEPYLRYLDALADAAKDYAAKGFGETALWFQDEHDLLAQPVGATPLGLDVRLPPDAASVPYLGAPTHLGARGWTEDPLTDFDRFRKPGNWFVTPEGNLVVGAAALSTLEKEHVEEFVESFTRSVRVLDAGYVFHARVHLLTPYVDAVVVLAHTRRDRNVRIELRAGHRPRPDEGPQPATVHHDVFVEIRGMRRFDGWHEEGNPGRAVPLDDTDVKNALDLVVAVEGCRLHAFVNGEDVGTYVDADGLPLDGAIGVATSAGIVRLDAPTVARVRIRDPEGRPVPPDAEVAAPRAPIGDWVVERRIHGIPTGAHGTFVAWYPLGYARGGASPETYADGAAEEWTDLLEDLAKRHHGARVVVVVPSKWPPEMLAAFRKRFDAIAKPAGAPKAGESKTPPNDVLWLEHGEGTAPGTSADPAAWGTESQMLFVDPVGLVRHHTQAGSIGAPKAWENWLALTRGW